MLVDVVEVKVIKNHVLFLRFEDGVCGEIDISKVISFEGVFSKLKNLKWMLQDGLIKLEV